MKFFDSTELKLFLSIAIVYLFFIHWIGWNENSRLNLTMAIVDKGALEIDDYYNNTGDRAFYNGHYYSDKAPGLSFFAVPIYSFSKLVLPETVENETIVYDPTDPENGLIINLTPEPNVLLTMILSTFIISSILTALTAILIFRISKYFTKDRKIRLLLPLIYSFGTLAFPLALVFYAHAASTFFVFLSFYIIFWMKQEKKYKTTYALLAGLSAGMAFLVEYTTLPFSIGILLYLLAFKNENFRNKSVLFFLVAFAIANIPLFLYNSMIYGNPLEAGYYHLDLKQFDVQYVNERLGTQYTVDTVFNASRTELFLEFNSDPDSIFYHLNIIVRLLFYPYRGLFFYYPILPLSVFGLIHLYKRQKFLVFSVMVSFSLILWVISTPYFHWWGGAIFGPRQLLPVIPFLMLPLAQLSRKIPLVVIIILFLLSVFINILGLQPPESILPENYTVMSKEYLQQVNSIAPFGNPLIDYYLPRFVDEGPQSKLLDGLLFSFPHVDIRDFAFDYDYKKLFVIDNLGILVLKPDYLMAILLPLLLVIWFKELSGKIGIHESTFLVFTTILAIVILSVDIRQFTYDDNWYKEPVEAPRWQSQDGTLTYFSPEDKRAILNFSVGAYNKTRTLDIHVNDKFVDSYLISSGEEFILYGFDLKKGETKITFHSKEGCDFPEKDLRCLSFSVGEIIETDRQSLFSKQDLIVIKKNFYANNGTKEFVPDRFTLLVDTINGTNVSLNLNIRSYYRPRHLEIFEDGEFIANYYLGTSATEITTPIFLLEGGTNRIEFSSNRTCDIPRDVENSTDSRCISFEVANITVTKTN